MRSSQTLRWMIILRDENGALLTWWGDYLRPYSWQLDAKAAMEKYEWALMACSSRPLRANTLELVELTPWGAYKTLFFFISYWEKQELLEMAK